jgi:hypothetical protein
MQISFPPDIERFVRHEIDAGHYSSPQVLVQETVRSPMVEEVELDEETIAAINDGQSQIDRGRGMDRSALVAELNRQTGLNVK